MNVKKSKKIESILSGVAGHYLVAAELSRLGYIATPTLRNTRGVDVLASNADGTKAITIQVKTNQRSKPSWMLSGKAEKLIADSLFYVFVNLNGPGAAATFHVVDSRTVANHIRESHQAWLALPKRDGAEKMDSAIRKFNDAEKVYLNAWHRLGLDNYAAG